MAPGRRRQRDRTKANVGSFTLTELLVVIAVILVLVALLMPVLGQAKEKARQVVCTSQLRQVSMAAGMYMEEYKGWGVMLDRDAGITRFANPTTDEYSTFGMYLPYLDLPDAKETPQILICPSDAYDRLAPDDFSNYRTSYWHNVLAAWAKDQGECAVSKEYCTRLMLRPSHWVIAIDAFCWFEPMKWDPWVGNHRGQGFNVTCLDGSVNWRKWDAYAGFPAWDDPWPQNEVPCWTKLSDAQKQE